MSPSFPDSDGPLPAEIVRLLYAERAFTTQELADIAQRVGWQYQRTNGSHQIFAFPDWSKHLSLPANKEYPWGPSKGFLREIAAPYQTQAAAVQDLLETLEAELKVLIDQYQERLARYEDQHQERLARYENQRIAEVEQELEALKQEFLRSLRSQPPIGIDPPPTRVETPPSRDRSDTLKVKLERLRQDLTHHQTALQHTQADLQTTQQQLQTSKAINRDRQVQLEDLQQDHNRLRHTLRATRIGGAVALAVFGGIAVGSWMLRPVCEPVPEEFPQTEQL